MVSGLEDEVLAVIEGEPEVVEGGQAHQVLVAEADDDGGDDARLWHQLHGPEIPGDVQDLNAGKTNAADAVGRWEGLNQGIGDGQVAIEAGINQGGGVVTV